MFDTVLGRGNVPKARFGIGTITSIVVHVLILGVAIWFSTRPPSVEEKPPEVTFFAAPPPPPPPPPPPASSKPKTTTEVKKKPVKKPDTVVTSKDPTPQPEEPQQDEASDEPQDEGVEGGVIGGVAGGVVGGVIGGQIGGQLGGQLGGDVVNFGEGMNRPDRVRGRDPQYTREALEAHIEGVMIVQCVITTDGDLQDCKIIKPLPHMEQAVLDALKTWKMSPVTFQGRPVAVKYNIPIRLKLPR